MNPERNRVCRGRKKCRKVCCLPKVSEFHPEGGADRIIILSVDEYETIRLIDKEGCSQEECAEYMQVARITVQSIYNSSRRKLAAALVDGLSIRIEGGDYTLCSGEETRCGCKKHCGMKCAECE